MRSRENIAPARESFEVTSPLAVVPDTTVCCATTIALLLAAGGAFGYRKWKERSRVREQMAILEDREHVDILARDPDLRAALERDFVCIAGNASFEDAKVVALGEIHFTMADIAKLQPADLGNAESMEIQRAQLPLIRLLKRTAVEGDRYLLEGVPKTREPLQPEEMFALGEWRKQLVERGVIVGGWDAPKEERETNRGRHWLLFGRNEEYLLPSILESTAGTTGRLYVQAGLSHIIEDRRIEETLSAQGIPYLFLGEKFALEWWKKHR